MIDAWVLLTNGELITNGTLVAFFFLSFPPHSLSPYSEHFLLGCVILAPAAQVTHTIVSLGLPSGDNLTSWWCFRHIRWQESIFYSFSYPRDLTSVL